MDHREDDAGSTDSQDDLPSGAVAEVFGAVLRRRRTEAELTQAELAEASGLHDTYISLLERGKNQPSLGVMIRLARSLEASVRDLAGEVEDRVRGRAS